jgi:hypothetical protein
MFINYRGKAHQGYQRAMALKQPSQPPEADPSHQSTSRQISGSMNRFYAAWNAGVVGAQQVFETNRFVPHFSHVHGVMCNPDKHYRTNAK